MNTTNTKTRNPIKSVVAYGDALLAEMTRAWQARAETGIDWERMADLSRPRFCEFVRHMSWRVIEIGGKPEYYDEGMRVLDQFLTLSGEMLTSAPTESPGKSIERIRAAQADVAIWRERFEKKKAESIDYSAKVRKLIEMLCA